MELSTEALAALTGEFTELSKQDQEARAAQREADRVAATTTQQQLSLAREASVEAVGTAAEQASILSAMEQANTRVSEINDSFLLQIVEPVMGMINKNFSRERLAKEIQNKDTALTIVQSRAAQKAAVRETKSTELKLRSDLSQTKAEGEIHDVQGLMRSVQSHITAINTLDAEKERLLARTDPKNLSTLVGVSGITEREVKEQQQLLSNKDLQSQQLAMSTTLESMQLTAAKLDRLSDVQLSDPKAVAAAGATMSQARMVRLEKSAQRTAWERTASAQNEELIAAKLADTAPDQLKLIAEGKVKDELVSPARAASALVLTTAKSQQAEGRTLAVEAAKRAGIEANRVQILNTMAAGQARSLYEQSLTEGRVAVTDPETKATVTFTSTELASRVDGINKEEVSSALVFANIQQGDGAVNDAVRDIARVAGIPLDPNLPLADSFKALADSNVLPSAERTAMNRATAMLEVANENATKMPKEALTSRAKAMQTVHEVQTAARERQLEGRSADEKGAIQRYWDNPRHQVATSQDAKILLIPAIQSQTSTFSPSYNSAVETFTTALYPAAPIDPETGKVNRAGQASQQMLRVPGGEAERFNTVFLDSEVRKLAVVPIISQVQVSVVAAAATSLGNQNLAQQLLSGQGVGADPRRILAAVEAAGVPVSTFMQEMRNLLPGIVDQITTPQGPEDRVMAAFNQVLFQNMPQAVIANDIDSAFNAAFAAWKEEQVRSRPSGTDEGIHIFTDMSGRLR